MATIIQNAAKGQRKAMEFLYEANKRKVFFIANSLLSDKVQAIDATISSFRNAWTSIKDSGITTEEEFTHLVIKKVVDLCKRKTTKKNPKAFRLPQNKNFLNNISKADVGENVVNTILTKLPELQHYIFVLHTACDYSNEEIAATFRFDVKTVKIALEAEKTNIEQIISYSNNSSKSYDGIIQDFLEAEKDIDIPVRTNEQVAIVIDSIATPIEKKKKKQITIISIVSVVLCLCIIGGVFLIISLSNNGNTNQSEDSTSTTATSNDTETSDVSTTDTTYTPDELDSKLTYYADIDIQDYGTITVQLDQEAAPITCANFVSLANSGFYDGLTFHRIKEDFMMQGGDPNGDGTGGSENTIVGEFTDNGYENNLSHTRGAISMARSSDYNSASSQFFIVHQDSTYLDGQYAVFGYVTEGLDVVDAVCEAAEPTDSNGTIEADAQPVITSITIRTE